MQYSPYQVSRDDNGVALHGGFESRQGTDDPVVLLVSLSPFGQMPGYYV
jgi:hypothetical protein